MSTRPTPSARQTWVGQSPPRVDGDAKVRGTARYLDDLTVDGAWFGATVRSPHPAARIIRIDPSPALVDPEVVVLTAADLPGPNVVKLIVDDWPVLAAGEVHHVYEAVALVAAPTRERARRAAAAVQVQYAPLPAVLTLTEALEGLAATPPALDDGASAVPAPVEVASPAATSLAASELPTPPISTPRMQAACSIGHGDVDAALATADLVVEGEYESGLQEHVYIEPHGVIATPQPDGTLELIGSLQCPYYVHAALVHLFGVEKEQIRVRQSVTGGGFGGKEDYPSLLAAHASLLAHRLGRPVRMVYDRHEDMTATTKRHPSLVRHRTGLNYDGTLVAMEIDVTLEGGAYTTLSPVVLSRAVLHAGGPYLCPNVRVRGRVLTTNMPPNGAFRGFGAPQVHFGIERQMDLIARRLGIDPLTMRARNAYRPGDVTPTGQTLSDSVGATQCLEEAERRTGFRRRWLALEEERRRRDPDDGAPQRGVGLALYWHGAGFTGNGERRMRSPAAICLTARGRIEVRVSSTEFGQGTETVLAQIAADAVGVPLGAVDVAPIDTDVVPDSGPTVASRTVMIIGGVLVLAGRRLARTLCEFAASSSGDGGADGLAIVGGQLVRLPAAGEAEIIDSFDALATRYLAAHGALEIEERHQPADDQKFDEERYVGTAYPAYAWGCDVVEVQVDPDTFAVTPERATMVCEIGRAIHPVLCAGQIEGGTLQALAYGYLEEVKREDGRYLNDRMATYIIPTTLDVPAMETVLLEEPASSGPYGAKGVGELPMDGGAPALVQAIENATGIRVACIPATPERLLADWMDGERMVDPRSAGPAGAGQAGEEPA